MGSTLINILAGIHSKGVVHRDLKPQNIMLDQHSQLYIVDYGISRKIGGKEDEPNKKQSFVGDFIDLGRHAPLRKQECPPRVFVGADGRHRVADLHPNLHDQAPSALDEFSERRYQEVIAHQQHQVTDEGVVARRGAARVLHTSPAVRLITR